MTTRIALVAVLVLAGCGSSDTRPMPAEKGPLSERYRDIAARIIRATMDGNDSYQKLMELCDGIGHRLSGSENLEKAVEWAVESMKADGGENCRAEKVMVPKWVRGKESITMTEPRYHEFTMLGLGGSVGTPPDGITAEVLVVKDREDLDSRGSDAEGKIVVFNYPMPRYDPKKGAGYGQTVQYRLNGADWASKHGAVAALVRSVTAHSLNTPHTGMMRYSDKEKKIPTAAITIEDAETLARLQKRGITPVLNVKMEAKDMGLAPSANAIGELRGRTNPDEIVVIGGHLDSWDTGQGAHDDGTGCVAAMEVINILRKANLIPRRTIRVVLYTNEENGMFGARQYVKDHEAEMPKHYGGIESDSGGFAPKGFRLDLNNEAALQRATIQVRDILSLLESIGATTASPGGSAADVGKMKPFGVPVFGLMVEGSRYFDTHHTPADTVEKVDPKELSQCTAAMAVLAYILADMPGKLGDTK